MITKRKTIIISLLCCSAIAAIPLVSLVSCGDKPQPVPETYTISGGSTNLTGISGQSGSDSLAWAVKNSKGETVTAALSIEGIESSSDFPTWIRIDDGKVNWTVDASKGTYKFRVKAIIQGAAPIRSDTITLMIEETPEKVNFDWEFYRDGTAILKEYKGQDSEVVIPKTVENNGKIYSVTSIGGLAFYNCSFLTSVTIPDSVTGIGSSAFYGCDKLTDTSGPSGFPGFKFLGTIVDWVAIIRGDGWHGGTTPATKIQCSDGIYGLDYKIIQIDDFDFIIDELNNTAILREYKGKGGKVVIPKTVENDGKVYAVTSIGKAAFSDCSSLTSVTIPDSVTSIGEYAFAICSSLSSVNISNSVTSIGTSAFYHCSSLISVTIPNSVTSIGYGAFYNCSSLTSVTIPDSVTYIGDYAFMDCIKLKDNSGPSGSPGFEFSGTFAKWMLITRGDEWHGGTTSATSIQCSDGIYGLDYKIILTGDFEFIINEADHTATLTEYKGQGGKVVIPRTVENNNKIYTVTSIDRVAFSGCSSLTSVTIPDSVTSIGEYAFYGCDKLTDTSGPGGSPGFEFSGTIAKWTTVAHGDNWHGGTTSATKIQCYDGVCGLDYKIIQIGDFKFVLNEADNTATVNEYIGQDSEAVIPKTVENDGKVYAVTSIGEYAFYYCSSLTSVTIPDSVTYIGDYAFASCSSLVSITIPDSVTSIGIGVLYDCSSLVSITIPDGVTSIGYGAFYNCSSLTSVTIPDSVTYIGDYAFMDCTKLTDNSGPGRSPGFKFLGTIAKWTTVARGTGWHSGTTPATSIRCHDGDCRLDN